MDLRIIKSIHYRIVILIGVTCLTTLVSYSGVLWGKENPLRKQSFEQIVLDARRHQIYIVDWRVANDTAIYTVNIEKTNDRKSWLKYLTSVLPNHAIVHSPIRVEIYLLPLGIGKDDLMQAADVSKRIDIDKIIQKTNGRKEVKDKNVLSERPLILLKSFAEHEMTYDTHYKRIINPQKLSSAYNFTTRYDNRLDMVVPYLKNGKPVSGKMEGFSSYKTFFDFIKAHVGSFRYYRSGKWAILKLKGDKQSELLISAKSGGIQIVSKALLANGSGLSVYLEGDRDGFTCVGKLRTGSDNLTIIDLAKIE